MNLFHTGVNKVVEEMIHIDTHKSQKKQKVFRERYRKGYGDSEANTVVSSWKRSLSVRKIFNWSVADE